MGIVESLYNLAESNQNILYHATFGCYIEQIQEEGLIPGKNKNWSDSSNKVVDLADDKEYAASFCEVAEVSDEVYDSGIYVVGIDASKLDMSKMSIDKNNLAEDTYEYEGTIPTYAFVSIEEFD